MTVLVVCCLSGSLVAVQLSEPDAERKVRAQRLQDEFLNIACKQGKKACDEAQEEIRRRNCEYYGKAALQNLQNRDLG